jgi:hypothetical protein
LLAHLVVLWVRRRPALLAIVVVALVSIVLVSRGRTTESRDESGDSMAMTQAGPALQTAVLKDGFAILENVGDRHVVEVDQNGTRRRRSAIPTVTETRVFGSPSGAGVGWLQGRRIHIAVIKGDGELGKSSAFGTSVKQMCYGLASNDQRWAIGWLEDRDDRMWFVHGPTVKSMTSESVPGTASDVEALSFAMAEPSERASWCAVRSANDYVALIYRIEAKTFVNMCSKRECSGIQTRMPIDPRDEILDIACQREGCLVALRSRDGTAHLVAFNLRGKSMWTKKLPYATKDSPISLAAAGDRAYAVSLVTEEGPVVDRVLVKNWSCVRAWHGAQGLGHAAITWAKDYLLLAYWDGESLGHDLSAMPR